MSLIRNFPGYADHAMSLQDAAHRLAKLLEGDVEVGEPDALIAVLRSAVIRLGKGLGELAVAADAAGQGGAAA
ncbi:hypothetical protein [Micromonospora sp. NPDC005174]|uniref:hypothetical protein n=1 Tax=Micromonospora sp. NPDC005174 TaxID=3157018 RepID=UPI0033B6924F